MVYSSAQKGRLAELYFKSECVKRNIVLSKPVTGDARYDYVMECGNRLLRVQVKWAGGKSSKASGVAVVSLAKTRGRRSKSRNHSTTRYTAEDVDIIVAYIPELDRFVMLGPEVFSGRAAVSIRIDSTKNNQKKKIIFAADRLW
jgi:PD-(D/E)XK endonuclease